MTDLLKFILIVFIKQCISALIHKLLFLELDISLLQDFEIFSNIILSWRLMTVHAHDFLYSVKICHDCNIEMNWASHKSDFILKHIITILTTLCLQCLISHLFNKKEKQLLLCNSIAITVLLLLAKSLERDTHISQRVRARTRSISSTWNFFCFGS